MNTTTTTRTLLSARELADRWGVSTQSLANRRCAGTGLPFVKIHGSVRYKLADVEAYESAQTVRPIAV